VGQPDSHSEGEFSILVTERQNLPWLANLLVTVMPARGWPPAWHRVVWQPLMFYWTPQMPYDPYAPGHREGGGVKPAAGKLNGQFSSDSISNHGGKTCCRCGLWTVVSLLSNRSFFRLVWPEKNLKTLENT
jgi:hypothetical protein